MISYGGCDPSPIFRSNLQTIAARQRPSAAKVLTGADGCGRQSWENSKTIQKNYVTSTLTFGPNTKVQIHLGVSAKKERDQRFTVLRQLPGRFFQQFRRGFGEPICPAPPLYFEHH